MSRAAALEAFLARIYTDADARRVFLADPQAASLAAGLDAEQADELAKIDRIGLELTADSLEHKRRGRARSR